LICVEYRDAVNLLQPARWPWKPGNKPFTIDGDITARIATMCTKIQASDGP